MDHFLLSLDFHELWRSMMSICLLTEVKQQWTTLILGWVTISCRPAVGCVSVGISLCPQTFVNPSALLVSLMAFCAHAMGPKHFLALFYKKFQTFQQSGLCDIWHVFVGLFVSKITQKVVERVFKLQQGGSCNWYKQQMITFGQ